MNRVKAPLSDRFALMLATARGWTRVSSARLEVDVCSSIADFGVLCYTIWLCRSRTRVFLSLSRPFVAPRQVRAMQRKKHPLASLYALPCPRKCIVPAAGERESSWIRNEYVHCPVDAQGSKIACRSRPSHFCNAGILSIPNMPTSQDGGTFRLSRRVDRVLKEGVTIVVVYAFGHIRPATEFGLAVA